MKTIEGSGKLYKGGNYVCATKYYLTWEDAPANVSTFTGRQLVEGLTSAAGSLAPDERIFDVGDELQLELENGAFMNVIVTDGDSSDPLSAILVQVSGK